MASKRILSVEIGSSITRVCEVDYRVKNPRVYNQFILDTPEGVMEDGTLKITPDYVTEFKAALSKNKIKAKKIVFSITSTKIASKEITIPKVKENRIAALVLANASDYFPVDLEEYELAHLLLDTVKDEMGTESYKVMVLAASKAMLTAYEKLAETLGMSVLAIDYGGNSLYQMFKTECGDESSMIIKVDGAASLVLVTDNQSMVLQRTVSYGINEVIEAFKDTMGRHWDNSTALKELEQRNYFAPFALEEGEQEEQEASAEQSEYAVQEMEDGEQPSYGQEILDEQVIEEEQIRPDAQSMERPLEERLAEAFSYTMLGISRIYDYQNSRNPQRPITKVYLTGMGAGIKGLSDLLSDHLGIQVSILKLKGEFRFRKKIVEEEADAFAGCLGATIAPLGFSSIKMEGKKGKKGKEGRREKGYGAPFLAVCILASLIIGGVGAAPYALAYMENQQKRIAIEELSRVVPVYQEYVMTKNANSYLQAAYEYTVLPTENLVDFIKEMEAKMPSSMYLSSFSANKSGVTFNVITNTKQQAADVLLQLRSFESLVNISVNAVTDTRDEETEGSVTFTVTADYVNGKSDEAQQEAVPVEQEIMELQDGQ